MVIVGEVVLEKVIGELIKAIVDGEKKAATCGEILKRVESILKLIGPTVHEIKQLSGKGDRPKEESENLIQLFEEGQKLIDEYHRAHWRLKDWAHAGKVTAFYKSLLLFFQYRLPLEQFKINMECLARLQSQLKSGTVEVSGQIGFLGSGGKPPDFMVGLDEPLREVKKLLFENDASVIVVWAPGGCGKTTLVQKLCQEPDVKGIQSCLFSLSLIDGRFCFGENVRFYLKIICNENYILKRALCLRELTIKAVNKPS